MCVNAYIPAELRDVSVIDDEAEEGHALPPLIQGPIREDVCTRARSNVTGRLILRMDGPERACYLAFETDGLKRLL
jgi:hypothetical protein